jgi:hypothetical protein
MIDQNDMDCALNVSISGNGIPLKWQLHVFFLPLSLFSFATRMKICCFSTTQSSRRERKYPSIIPFLPLLTVTSFEKER